MTQDSQLFFSFPDCGNVQYESCFTVRTWGRGQAQLVEAPTPEPQKERVLVRLVVAAINHVILGPKRNSSLPCFIAAYFGRDGAGDRRRRCGPEAEGISAGDRVVIISGITCDVQLLLQGTRQPSAIFFEFVVPSGRHYTEYVSFLIKTFFPSLMISVLKKAAAFSARLFDAWPHVDGRAKLAPKKKCWWWGQPGVAIAAIQIAKWREAHVLAVTTSPGKAEKLKRIGADEVFCSGGRQRFRQVGVESDQWAGVEVRV